MPGLGIKVTFDSHEFERKTGTLCRDQIPYASAVALTKLATMSRDQIKQRLPSEFKIRNRWTQGGIRADMANKRDWPDQTAEVGSLDPYMVDFVKGGRRTTYASRTKRKKVKGFVRQIKVRQVYKIGENRVVPRSKWPKSLLVNSASGQLTGQSFKGMPGTRKGRPNGSRTKPKPFLAVMGSGKSGVFIRTGPKRRPVTKLYDFGNKPSTLPRIDWLESQVRRVVALHGVEEFDRALAKAMEGKR